MCRQELDQRGPGHAALGVIEHAVQARKQFLAVDPARPSGLCIGKSKLLQPEGRQRLAAAMDGNFDAIGKRVERNVNDLAIATEFRNGFAADVPRGPCQLRARFRLKSRLDRLVFHGAAEYPDQIPILVQVKHDAYRLVSHWIGHWIGPR